MSFLNSVRESGIHAIERSGRVARDAFIATVDALEPMAARSKGRLGSELPQDVTHVLAATGDPVFVVGGWTSSGKYLGEWVNSMRLDGFQAHRFDPYANGLVNIDRNVIRLAQQVQGHAQGLPHPNALLDAMSGAELLRLSHNLGVPVDDLTHGIVPRHVNFIGHSEGGLISTRYAQLQAHYQRIKALPVEERGGALAALHADSPEFASYINEQLKLKSVRSGLELPVANVVAIGSPFDGVGRLPGWDNGLGDAMRGNRIARAAFGEAALQMTSGSPYLRLVREDALPSHTTLTTIEGARDLLVPRGHASHPKSTHLVVTGSGTGGLRDILESNHLFQVRHPEAFDAARLRLMSDEARRLMPAESHVRFERLVEKRSA